MPPFLASETPIPTSRAPQLPARNGPYSFLIQFLGKVLGPGRSGAWIAVHSPRVAPLASAVRHSRQTSPPHPGPHSRVLPRRSLPIAEPISRATPWPGVVISSTGRVFFLDRIRWKRCRAGAELLRSPLAGDPGSGRQSTIPGAFTVEPNRRHSSTDRS